MNRRIATIGMTGPGRHFCRVPDCTAQRRPTDLMCVAHWRLVPRPLRIAIWQQYDQAPGSPQHLRLCQAAIKAATR